MDNFLKSNEMVNYPSAIEVFEQALAGFRANDPLPWITLLDDDALLELPFNPPGQPKRLSGKKAILSYFESLPASIDFESFSEVFIHSLDDRDWVVAELTAKGTIQASGKTYDNRYVIVMNTSEGQIRLQRDYFNPLTAIDS
ncbi:nuclear transport factor 2 family protein [Alkalicoccobacillus porphyridii]|nr:nuclear transport factor 2 family protein [Alkalicoccobacillus porphyridii]